ncbi:MAG: DUF1917 domain-containing protein [Chloroflexota bacterium]|nr:DUF1917 domain-containing protein [Chloroflexota bacterium]
MTEQDPLGRMNLDLIEMVQRARMMHDEDARPSDYAAVYWIEAKRGTGDYPAPTANAGEWRVRLTVATVDAVWEMVKRATVAGKLGYKSKVSTRPAAGQADPDERLICMRTYDARDADDVERVRAALQAIGLEILEYVADK